MIDDNASSDDKSQQTHEEQPEDKRTNQPSQRLTNFNLKPNTSKFTAEKNATDEESSFVDLSLFSNRSTDELSHPENVDKSELHQIVRDGDVAMMRITIDQLDPSLVNEQLNMTDKNGYTPLHYAAESKHVEMCKLLVEKGADMDICNKDGKTALHRVLDENSEGPNIQLVKFMLDRGARVEFKDYLGRTPLHYTARNGHVACAKLLVEKYKGSNEMLDAEDFIDSKDKRRRTPLHLACWKGHTEMVRFLLQLKADVTHRTQDGWNALDFTIDTGNTSCAQVIIEDEKWRDALKNSNRENFYYMTDGLIETPMRKLIRKMPEIAEKVFTKCIERGDDLPVDHENYLVVKFNYEFLDDEFSCYAWPLGKEAEEVYDKSGHVVKSAVPYIDDPNRLEINHPLNIMVEAKQKKLLRHPLVASLLNHKWRAYVRAVYYLNLLLYLIFMGIFNSYMLTMPPPYSIDSSNVTQSCVAIITEAQPTHGLCYNYNSWGIVAKYFVIVLSAISLVKESYQVYSQRISYFKSFTNLFEVSLYILAILTVYSDTSSAGVNYVGVREDWQWQIGAVSIFLSWMVLIMFIRNQSTLGIFVLMFNHVLWTFMKFFVVFLLFIIGFAFSFHCLLQNQYAFRQWGIAVLKTLILMTGEFQFDEIFLSEVGATETGANNYTISISKVNYRAVSYILFIIFVIIMSIIIMNLLVGLAVDDITSVQKNAELESLTMQVKLTLDVEYTMPQFIRRRFMRKYRKIFPNQHHRIPAFLQWLYSVETLNLLTINEAPNAEKNGRDKIEEQVESLDGQVKSLDQEIKSLDQKVESLDQKVESLKAMMSAIISHFNIGADRNNDDDDINA